MSWAGPYYEVPDDGPSYEVGAELPVLRRTMSSASMIAYAGATWDWHKLHYDHDYVSAKQLPAPVVDGQVFGALLVEQVQDWLGPGAMVRSLSFRFANLVYAGEIVQCQGRVTAYDAGLVTVTHEVVVLGDDGQPRHAAVSTATSTARVPAPGGVIR